MNFVPSQSINFNFLTATRHHCTPGTRARDIPTMRRHTIASEPSGDFFEALAAMVKQPPPLVELSSARLRPAKAQPEPAATEAPPVVSPPTTTTPWGAARAVRSLKRAARRAQATELGHRLRLLARRVLRRSVARAAGASVAGYAARERGGARSRPFSALLVSPANTPG